MSPSIRVQWRATGTPEFSTRLIVSLEELAADACDVLVIEFLDIENALSIRNRLSTCTMPVLLLVNECCLSAAYALVREEDDICMIGSPSLLIEYRLIRLHKVAQTRRDSLTALRSRKELIRYLSECCDVASVARPVSVILVDLDHFKGLNDQHGHAVGDTLLVECGRLLEEFTSHELFVARFGGEEFVLVSHLDELSTRRTAEQLRLAIASHEFNNEIRMTTSIGIGTTDAPVEVSELLSQADEALYAAKAGGRNLVYSYDQLKTESTDAGEDVDLAGLENRARVFSERVMSLITQRSKTLIAGLKHDATTDPLTQMYNRRYLDAQLALDVAAAQRDGFPLCVALLDVDHFGQVNKVHGWPTGDAVLRQVATLIQSNIRETDWVGRYGGEEFCLVLTNTNLTQSQIVLERLRKAVQNSAFESTDGTPLRVTVSIGVVESDIADGTPLELMERASVKTIAAKNAGRNCLRF